MTIVARDYCDGGFNLWGVLGPQAVCISPEGGGFRFSAYTPAGNQKPVSGDILGLIHQRMCFREAGAILVMEAGIIVCDHCQRQHCRIKEEVLKEQKMREKRAKLAAFYARLSKGVVTSN